MAPKRMSTSDRDESVKVNPVYTDRVAAVLNVKHNSN